MNHCEQHKNDETYESPDEIACPECSRLIATKYCEGCDRYFIDWTFSGFDDFIAGPASTSQGDFICVRCLPRAEKEIDEAEQDDAWYDFSGYGYVENFNAPAE